MIPRVSLIIPAFNEAPHIVEVLIDMKAILDARGEDYEIIVVDDGSQDNTAVIAEKMAKTSSNIRIIGKKEKRK